MSSHRRRHRPDSVGSKPLPACEHCRSAGHRRGRHSPSAAVGPATAAGSASWRRGSPVRDIQDVARIASSHVQRAGIHHVVAAVQERAQSQRLRNLAHPQVGAVVCIDGDRPGSRRARTAARPCRAAGHCGGADRPSAAGPGWPYHWMRSGPRTRWSSVQAVFAGSARPCVHSPAPAKGPRVTCNQVCPGATTVWTANPSPRQRRLPGFDAALSAAAKPPIQALPPAGRNTRRICPATRVAQGYRTRIDQQQVGEIRRVRELRHIHLMDARARRRADCRASVSRVASHEIAVRCRPSSACRRELATKAGTNAAWPAPRINPNP